MNNDRFKFRKPVYCGSKFMWFEYCTVGEHYKTPDDLPEIDLEGKTLRYGDEEQCTGLKDKNGNLIYQNDRLRDDVGNEIQYKYGIANHDHHGGYNISGFHILTTKRSDGCMPSSASLEIIGNIHEKGVTDDK